jgi:hypothetical protein
VRMFPLATITTSSSTDSAHTDVAERTAMHAARRKINPFLAATDLELIALNIFLPPRV